VSTRAATKPRGTTNGNVRGSAEDRRVRKRWLLARFGNGETAPCYRCPTVLDFETITVDRIIPGCEGGTYRRSNIRPACAPCNESTGGSLGAQRAAANRLSRQQGDS
jgi:hypothetical protein